MEAGETEITVKSFPAEVETFRSIVPEPGITIIQGQINLPTTYERKEVATMKLETPILAADSAEPPFHPEIPVVVR